MISLDQSFDFIDEKKYPSNYQLFLLFLSILGILIAFVSSGDAARISIGSITLPPVCLFRLATGLDCPACGLTRAVVLAFHGAWKASYLVHIWGIPVAAFLALQIPYRVYRLSGGAPIRLSEPVRNWTYRLVVLSLLGPWAVKMATALL